MPEKAGLGQVSVLTRSYFETTVSVQLDKERVHAVEQSFSIEKYPPPPRELPPPPPPNAYNVAARIYWLRNFFLGHSVWRSNDDPSMVPAWWSLRPNFIGRPALFRDSEARTGGVGAPDVAYAAGPWKLAPEQALIIHGELPDAVFGNMLLINRYLQSLDFHNGRPQSFNRAQLMHRDPEYSQFAASGKLPFRVVLAHKDPGGGVNWLDTERRAFGTIFFRFMLPGNLSDVERFTTRVVPFRNVLTAWQALAPA